MIGNLHISYSKMLHLRQCKNTLLISSHLQSPLTLTQNNAEMTYMGPDLVERSELLHPPLAFNSATLPGLVNGVDETDADTTIRKGTWRSENTDWHRFCQRAEIT